MRLADLRPEHVVRAIEIYLEHAFPRPAEARCELDLAPLRAARTLDELFERFVRPTTQEGGPLLERYTLRLGNERYPFMKFVIQEYLLDEQYFFSVDTHDDLDVPADDPDYPGWREIKRHNRDLKRRIEAAWAREGLPTNDELLRLAQRIASSEQEVPRRGLVLLADDEEAVARGLAALLATRGYDAEVVLDGEAALERMRRDPLPDLVLLDYGMPEQDGAQVLERLRADPRTRGTPVLLATAASIDLARLQGLGGLLRKPYSFEVLLPMIEKLIGGRPQP